MTERESRRPHGSTMNGQVENPRLRSNKVDVPPTPDTNFKNLRNRIEAQFQQLPKSKASANGGSTQSKRSNKPLQRLEREDTRGKKRDRNGDEIKPTLPSLPATGQVPRQSPPVENEFESEVRALGGTSEDIELVMGVGSDSEIEGAKDTGFSNTNPRRNGKDIQKGISNILKEIASSQGAESGAEDPSQESEEESVPPPVAESSTLKKRRDGSHFQARGLRCEPRPDWFEQEDADMDVETPTMYTASHHTLELIQSFAKTLLENENEAYKKGQQSSSSQSFYNTVITSGTLSDKISALTLAVQESPIHNVKALETLVGLSKKRSRSQAVDVLRALKDLFAQGSLLPSTRRLYAFTAQPALLASFGRVRTWKTGDPLPKGITEAHLISWAYESWLKEQYFEVLKTLEVWCNDEIEFSKARAISYVYELLKEKPEQESNLLRLLVNKLGDPIKKIASQTSYLLMQLLTAHPAMKNVVVSAIEADFIFRPGQSLHGKYYAAVTLNQTALSSKEEDVAVKLLGIYFGLFTAMLKTGDSVQPEPTEQEPVQGRQKRRRKKPVESGQAQSVELKEKLTSAILTGVNRAYPYAGPDHQNFSQHLDTLFKIAHSSNFNTGIQAMLLIQQLSASHQPSNDRFYRVLYESLLDQRLISSSKQQLYLNLMHRSLKADLNMKRVKAFVKRLLQVLSLHEPPFTCGAFFLLKDLESTFPALTSLIDQAEDHENDEEIFRDVDDLEDHIPQNHKAVGLGPNSYDAHKRAPEHANADNSCAWEVYPFLAHYHPSVSVSSEHFIRHTKMPGKPDLTLHTLIHFLDRFVYRNAKVSDLKPRGSSIMQPLAADNTYAVLINPTIGGVQRLRVNSEEFRAKNTVDIAAEDVFFHRYFATLGKEPAKKSKKSRHRETDDAESADEDEVWKAIMDSAPDLEGEGVSDDDLSMSDLESEPEAESEIEDEMNYEDEEADAAAVDIEAGIFDESDDGLLGFSAKSDEDSPDEVEAGAASADETETLSKKAKTAKKEQRKKLKSLPTFASAADYARMLDDDQDEDLG